MFSIKFKRLNTKVIAMIVIDVLVIIALIAYFMLVHNRANININGTFMTTPLQIANFSLTDHEGRSLTPERLSGKWSLVFFGFTSCPMACPTAMALLNNTYKKLETELPKNQLPNVIFISVDPERDSVTALNQFMTKFNPQFIGARADKREIIRLEKDLHIPFSADNLLNHSMDVLLINPDVRVQAYFSYPQNPDDLSKDYMKILKTFNER